MNYCVLNGVKSNTVKGLLIQELPPISKPLMRTQVEQIDGRDGDIVTPLGYAAYDKKMRIGLYGAFNIDDVISFFNSSGQVTFSNEPDKYYNYQILQQIDFNRLLRFREADITFHVQPFKYSAVDGVVSSKNILDATAIAINSTGNQYVTLTHGVGQLSIEVNASFTGGLFVGSIWVNGLEIGQTYTLSATSADSGFATAYVYTDKLYGNEVASGTLTSGITFTATTESVLIGFYAQNCTTGDSLTVQGIQFEQGVKTPYVPYNSVYVFNSGNTVSKPNITLSGSGTVNMSINGTQVLTVDLSGGDITINAAEMNAYQGFTLANRQVTGDYDNVILQTGANTVSCDGNPIIITIGNYSRWL